MWEGCVVGWAGDRLMLKVAKRVLFNEDKDARHV